MSSLSGRFLLYAAVRAFLFVAGGNALATQIMPLGDSLTYGSTVFGDVPGGYRDRFYANLTAAGHSVQLIGTRGNNPSPLLTSTGNAQHAGYPGWRIDQIQADLAAWSNTLDPDIVVLIIGTNDFDQNYDTPNVAARLAALLDDITAREPGVQILLSTIPLTTHWAINAIMAPYNAAMPGIAATRTNVHFFDNTGVLDIQTDYADVYHMNQQGYNKLGAALARETALILAPEPGTGVLTIATLALVVLGIRRRH